MWSPAAFRSCILKKIFPFLFFLFLLAFQVAGNESRGQNNQEDSTMRLRVTSNGKITEFELNHSRASRDLYTQLPMDIGVENFSNNEKIFYPPEKLNTVGTPLADAKAGTLAYYAPWGDVVMFYKDFGSASGLYELGKAVSGEPYIREMAGTVSIEAVE